MLIRNATVLHHNHLRPSTDVEVVDGRIHRIGTGLSTPPGRYSLDAGNEYLLPGFVDIHTHGIEDCNVQFHSLQTYSEAEIRYGATACLPTLHGSPQENMEAISRAWIETDGLRTTPNVVGFRPEIMYVAKTGAGDRRSLAQISQRTTDALWSVARGRIPIWDVAPELPGATEFVRWARRNHITASLAHSSATIEDARGAIAEGLELVTHFYCTFDVPITDEPGGYPHGLTDYLLCEDRVTVEVIPDGVHVHPILVDKVLRCKGVERVCFVTDSVKGAGNPPGEYEGLYEGTRVKVTATNGVRRISDGSLAGSALTPLAAFRNAVFMFGLSISEASKVCSSNPARMAGLRSKGTIEVGMDADMVILSKSLDLRKTIVGGRIAYDES